jgi:hypothetical protein
MRIPTLLFLSNILLSHSFFLNNFYYKIANLNEVTNKPLFTTINNRSLHLFKNKNGTITNNCSNLSINKGSIYYCESNYPYKNEYYPDEELNGSYRTINGTYLLQNNVNAIINNILSSGSCNDTLKLEELSFLRTSTTSFRQIKIYNNTQINTLEYHLPASIVYRNIDTNIGKSITKITFIQACPINEKETLLFWKIYRNYLIFKNDFLNESFDYLFQSQLITYLSHLHLINKKCDSRIQIEFKHDFNIYKEYSNRN